MWTRDWLSCGPGEQLLWFSSPALLLLLPCPLWLPVLATAAHCSLLLLPSVALRVCLQQSSGLALQSPWSILTGRWCGPSMAQVICASAELQSQESSCSLRCLDCPSHLCLCWAAVSGIQPLTAVPQLSQALVRLRACYTLGAADGTLFPVQQGRGRLNNSYISSELAANTGTACLGTRQWLPQLSLDVM